jgi:hypothetical protein
MILSSIACCMLKLYACCTKHSCFYFISVTPAHFYHCVTRSFEPWTARLKASGSQNVVGWNGQGIWHVRWRTEMPTEFWWGSLKERDARCNWEDNIKMDFINKTGWRPLHISGSGDRHVPGHCERGFETSGCEFWDFRNREPEDSALGYGTVSIGIRTPTFRRNLSPSYSRAFGTLI